MTKVSTPVAASLQPQIPFLLKGCFIQGLAMPCSACARLTSDDHQPFRRHTFLACIARHLFPHTLRAVPATGFFTLCRLFSNLVDVSKLEGKRDFMLFEDGIEPDWDDPGNEKGGLWLAHSSDMSLNSISEDGSLVTLHTVWLDTVCSLTPRDACFLSSRCSRVSLARRV